MNVASLKLCKELDALSGWSETDYFYQGVEHEDKSTAYVLTNPVLEGPLTANAYPAYDLGYLMRRLPAQTLLKREYDASPELPEATPAHYRALYDTLDGQHFWSGADTPENAAVLLAINLFKHGVLGGMKS